MTDQHATAPDGARIGFDTAGAGEPLVLLAGQANSRRWWDPVRADFAASYTTIATDHLGTGTSDSPMFAEWSTRRFARDVVAVLDELGVYGTSMGGRVAQWVAADHPGRVGALVLGCTTGAVPGRSRQPRTTHSRGAAVPGRGRPACLLLGTPGAGERGCPAVSCRAPALVLIVGRS